MVRFWAELYSYREDKRAGSRACFLLTVNPADTCTVPAKGVGSRCCQTEVNK